MLSKIKNKINLNLKYIYIIVIALAFFFFGFYFAESVNDKKFSSLASAADTPLRIPSLLEEVRKNIGDKFISWKATSTMPTEQDISYGMIKGYVSAYGDPYTQFFTPTEAKVFTETISGSFGGIGAQVELKNGRVTVSAPLKGSPAEKSGIKSGDVIISVNGTSTEGMSTDQAVAMIRGEVGTKVKLEVFHKDAKEITKLEIKREIIKVPEIDTEVLGDVFVIHFYSFTANSAADFEKSLQEFIKSGKTRLLVDLRGNGGGYLDAAINIASLFLPSDKVIVIEKGNRNDGDRTNYSKGFNYFNRDVLKMVVLIDGGSASASEIFAGAMKDNGMATIVGEKSFGKGSVQQLENLSDGSAIKVTIAKWYTPKGINISEAGIVPDVWASSTASTSKVKTATSTKSIDGQLKKAIDILKGLK